VSIWELSIKIATNKLAIDEDLSALCARMSSVGWQFLSIGLPESILAGALPPHHRDPFDRTLVAQSIVHGHKLISADTTLDKYGIDRAW
jgi:PIN domain nuclease of toxin-antitoxin system